MASGATPLVISAQKGYREIVRSLLQHGARTDAAGAQAMNALHLAAFGAFSEIIGLLAAAGIDVDLQDARGATALHYAVAKSSRLLTIETTLPHQHTHTHIRTPHTYTTHNTTPHTTHIHTQHNYHSRRVVRRSPVSRTRQLGHTPSPLRRRLHAARRRCQHPIGPRGACRTRTLVRWRAARICACVACRDRRGRLATHHRDAQLDLDAG